MAAIADFEPYRTMARLIDLSQEIYQGMKVYPGHLKTVVFEHATHEETATRFEGGFSFQTTGIRSTTTVRPTWTRSATSTPTPTRPRSTALTSAAWRADPGPARELARAALAALRGPEAGPVLRRLAAVPPADARLGREVVRRLAGIGGWLAARGRLQDPSRVWRQPARGGGGAAAR